MSGTSQSRGSRRSVISEHLEPRLLFAVQNPAAAAQAAAILPRLDSTVVSTIPSNGDVNPYGIAFVPDNFPSGGTLVAGNELVANFNNANNDQGTGTTITRVDNSGATSTFFQGSGSLGLDAGLAVLSKGFVLVGNVPATGNTNNPVGAGSILILNSSGTQVGQITGSFINGPWDFTVVEQNSGATAVLFVSNALDGTVQRVTLSVPSSGNNVQVTATQQIASGYTHGPNAAAFVLGPAGVAYDSANGNLYVNSEGDNAVYAIPNAMTATSGTSKGTLIFQDNTNLHGPLGLILASDGNLILANSDGVNASPAEPSELVEISITGTLLATHFIDPNNGGAFNIAEASNGGVERFAYVDDNTNTLTTWKINNTTPILSQLVSKTYSTIPSNGDVNPYGLAFVPQKFPLGGSLVGGNVLIANFNNANNDQGTGTTITRIDNTGASSTFFQGTAPLGLDAGLAVLSRGYVLVGNVPATGNTNTPVGAGSILILDKNGNLVDTLTGSYINGPWDFSVVEANNGATAFLFVSNALDGTVQRIQLAVPKSGGNFKVQNVTEIGSTYTHGPNANAFVLGPAGSAYDAKNHALYVDAEGDNAVYAIPNALSTRKNAGKGTLIFQDNNNLHGPLGLILATNGNLILANSDGVNADPAHPSELVEITTGGTLVATKFIDPNNGGAFNVAEESVNGVNTFAYVDDNTNTVTLWTVPPPPKIGGSVLNDAQATGVETSSDKGLGGFTVFLDLNGDGKLDANDPRVVTNGKGAYTITAPTAGTYTLSVVLPKGWRATNPTTDSYSVVTLNGQLNDGMDFLLTRKKA